MIKNNIYIIVIICIIIFSGCSDDPAFDILLGGQPNFINDEGYNRQINIFGVLRPDLNNNYPQSFIHLERTYAAINDTFSYDIIKNANVKIYLEENNELIDSFLFEYQNPDSLFKLFEYRNSTFIPKALEKYQIKCTAEGYKNAVYAETIIPKKPQLSGNINVNNDIIKLNLINDTSIFLYEIYVFDNENFDFSRILPSLDSITEVSLNPEFNLTNNTIIIIYSYDTNLATYNSYSNNFIKPGTYRPPITTVNGGVGCFGSMNFNIFSDFY